MLTPLRTTFLFALALLALLSPALGQDDAFSDAPDPNPVDTKRRWRMERANVLKKVDLQEVQAEGNFVFYIQQAFGQSENYNDRIVKMHLPWLQAAEKLFDETIRIPTGLSKEAEREPVAIIVLNSRGDMDNYLAHGEVRCNWHYDSGYDHNLAAVVTYSLTAPSKKKVDARARDLVHFFVHALWQAHTHVVDKRVGPYWLREAIADSIGMSFGKTATETTSREDFEAHALYITKALALDGFKNENLSTLDDMIREKSRVTDDKGLQDRLTALGTEQVRRYWMCYSIQGLLLFDFMRSGAEGIHSEALYRYLKLVLDGKTGPNTFREGMGTFVLSDLEIGYWQSIMETAKRVDKTIDLNAVRGHARVVQAAANLGATIKADAPRVATGAKLTNPLPAATAPLVNTSAEEVARAPVAITAPTWTSDDIFALALYRANSGDIDSALLVVEDFKNSMVAGVTTDDMERLRARLRATVDLRNECLQSVIATGTRFKVNIAGKNTNVTATGVTGDVIELVEGRKTPDTIALSALGLPEIVRMARKAEPELGDPELRGFLEALSQAKRWERTLKADLGDGPILKELVAEFKDLEQHVEFGSVVSALQSLSSLDLENAKAQVAQIEALLENSGGHDLVKQNNFFLASTARQLLLASFTDADIPQLLQAPDVSVQGDLISITYDFKNDSQLLDFPIATGSGSENFFDWQEPELEPKHWKMGVHQGELIVRGESIFRHIIPLSTPVHVEYSACNRDTEIESFGPGGYIGVSVCDDLKETYIFNGAHATHLRVSDNGEVRVAKTKGTGSSMMGKFYKVKFTVDEAEAKSFQVRAEDDTLTVPLSGPRQGYTQLFIRTDREVAIDTITIEGTLTDAIRAQIAELFANAQLRKLGLFD